MKKKLLYIFFLAGLIGFAQDTPASFSLNEAVEWGMNYNRTLKRATIEVQKAHKEKWKTLSIDSHKSMQTLSTKTILSNLFPLFQLNFLEGKQVSLLKLFLELNKPP